jgi:16S rRNA (cytosine1402-N4)-methyltransferase
MAVNDEFGAIKAGVKSAVEHLAPGARIAIISFHSGEDRIVKTLFRSLSQDGKLSLITKKPIVPSVNEQKGNPRSRSAKLRVAERATDIYTEV